jgi:hypothetical protein
VRFIDDVFGEEEMRRVNRGQDTGARREVLSKRSFNSRSGPAMLGPRNSWWRTSDRRWTAIRLHGVT